MSCCGEKARDTLFPEPRNVEGYMIDGSADGNLRSALYDLRRTGADEVSLRTIERVVDQLRAAKHAFDETAPAEPPQTWGRTASDETSPDRFVRLVCYDCGGPLESDMGTRERNGVQIAVCWACMPVQPEEAFDASSEMMQGLLHEWHRNGRAENEARLAPRAARSPSDG